jgi:4-carboxymuconolactone decarboxylase
MPTDYFTKGLEIRSELLGNQFVNQVLAAGGSAEDDVQRLVTEFTYGAIWSRPGLEMPTRSLITIALMASQNRLDTMKQHVKGGLTIGATREQIIETIIHLMPYCGIATVVQGVRAALAVFREEDEAAKAAEEPE